MFICSFLNCSFVQLIHSRIPSLTSHSLGCLFLSYYSNNQSSFIRSLQSVVHSFIHSFNCLQIHSPTHSLTPLSAHSLYLFIHLFLFARWFAYWFVRWFTHSFIFCDSLTCSFINSHLLTDSLNDLLIHSFSFANWFAYSLILIHSFTHWLAYSFIHSFSVSRWLVHWFTYSYILILSLNHSLTPFILIHLPIHSFIYSHSLTDSFILLIHSFSCSITCSFTHWFTNSLIHSFSFAHWLVH